MHSCADESRDSVTSTGVICKNYDKTDVKDVPARLKHNRNKKGGACAPTNQIAAIGRPAA